MTIQNKFELDLILNFVFIEYEKVQNMSAKTKT